MPAIASAKPSIAGKSSPGRPRKPAVAAKKVTAAKKSKNAASGPAHPPYFQMIKEAIEALRERSGSSGRAIAKYVEEKHGAGLPAVFRRMLSLQLRSFVAKGKLVKVKASFKLSDAGKKAPALPKSSLVKTTAPPRKRKVPATAVKKAKSPAPKVGKKVAKPRPKTIKSSAVSKRARRV